MQRVFDARFKRDGVVREDQDAVLIRRRSAVFEDEGIALGESLLNRDGGRSVLANVRERFAQRRQTVVRIDDVFRSRNHETLTFADGEGRGINVVFFVSFDDLIAGIDRKSNRIETGFEGSQVPLARDERVDVEPFALIEESDRFGAIGADEGLFGTGNDFAVFIKFRDGDRVIEGGEDRRIAVIAELVIEDDVPTFDEFAKVDSIGGAKLTDERGRFFREGEIDGAQFLRFDGAHVDGVNLTVDVVADEAILTEDVLFNRRTVKVNREFVRTGIKRGGRGGRRVRGVEFRIDRGVGRTDEGVLDEERTAFQGRFAVADEAAIGLSARAVFENEVLGVRRKDRVVKNDLSVGGVKSAAKNRRIVDDRRVGRVDRESRAGGREGVDRAAVDRVRGVIRDERVDEIEFSRAGRDRRGNGAAVAFGGVIAERGVDDRRAGVEDEDRAAVLSGSVAAEDGLVDVERTDGVDRAAEVRRVVVGELSRIDGQLAGVIDRAAETLAENDVVFSVVSERGVAIEADVFKNQRTVVEDRAADLRRAVGKFNRAYGRVDAFVDGQDARQTVAAYRHLVRARRVADRHILGDGDFFAAQGNRRLGVDEVLREDDVIADRTRNLRRTVFVEDENFAVGRYPAEDAMLSDAHFERGIEKFEGFAVLKGDSGTVALFLDERRADPSRFDAVDHNRVAALKELVASVSEKNRAVLKDAFFAADEGDRGAVVDRNRLARFVNRDVRAIRDVFGTVIDRVGGQLGEEGLRAVRGDEDVDVDVEIRVGVRFAVILEVLVPQDRLGNVGRAVGDGNRQLVVDARFLVLSDRAVRIDEGGSRGVVDDVSVEVSEGVAVLEPLLNAVDRRDVIIDVSDAVNHGDAIQIDVDVIRGGDEDVVGVKSRTGVKLDGFAQGHLVVQRIVLAVFVGGDDDARDLMNFEVGRVDVVVIGFGTVFFAVFDDFVIRVKGDRQGIGTDGKSAKVLTRVKDFAIRENPSFLVLPIEVGRAVRVTLNDRRGEGISFGVRSVNLVGDVELAGDKRVALIEEGEVEDDIFADEVVVDVDAVHLAVPEVDRIFAQRKIRSDDRLELVSAKVDRMCGTVDGQTDVTVVACEIEVGETLRQFIGTGVNDGGFSLEGEVAVGRIDKERIDADEGAVLFDEPTFVKLFRAGGFGVLDERRTKNDVRVGFGEDFDALSVLGDRVARENRVVDLSGTADIEGARVRRRVIGDGRVDQLKLLSVDRARESSRRIVGD